MSDRSWPQPVAPLHVAPPVTPDGDYSRPDLRYGRRRGGPDGRPHAAPTLFSVHAEAFWLPTLGGAARIRNVRAHPWLALSVVEGDHDTHAAVLAEGPVEILSTAPDPVQDITVQRNDGGTLDWAQAWLQLTPQRLFSFAEVAWRDATAEA